MLCLFLAPGAEGDDGGLRSGEQLVYLPEKGSCDLAEAEGLAQDARQWLFEIACYSTRWFDGLFGDDHEFEEREVGGLLRLGFTWDEYDKFDPKVRFSVRTPLPNLSSRLDAFIGRVEESDYVTDAQAEVERDFRPGDRDEDAEWLLGLGYDKGSERKTGWDYSAGVRLRFPPRPYVRARWRMRREIDKDTDFHFRQTFFWRDGVGFGTTSRIDTARRVSERNLLRLELISTWSEETRGADWWAGHTWYHNLGDLRGVSLLSFVRGETGREPGLTDYGFHLTYRQPLGRRWLYLNAGPTITWPRERPDEKRELSLGVSVLLELFFGNRYR